MSHSKTILIAEDELISYRLLKILIGHINPDINVLHAVDGKEAVEMFNSNIDLVLMDIKMPRMNGIEATKHIKAINPNIKIVAQTAFTQDYELALINKAGVNEVLSKPIKKSDLEGIFNKYL